MSCRLMRPNTEAANIFFFSQRAASLLLSYQCDVKQHTKVGYNKMCTCCGDQRMSLYRLISFRIVSPFKASASFLRGTNGDRQFTCWVMFCESLCRACWHTTTTKNTVNLNLEAFKGSSGITKQVSHMWIKWTLSGNPSARLARLLLLSHSCTQFTRIKKDGDVKLTAKTYPPPLWQSTQHVTTRWVIANYIYIFIFSYK